MTVFTEGLHPTEFILTDEGSYSRDQVVLAASAGALVPGTVMGKVTATGKWLPYRDTATDGTQTAAGILEYGAEDLTTDQKVVVITRATEVIGSLLTGLDANATADLLAAGIVVR